MQMTTDKLSIMQNNAESVAKLFGKRKADTSKADYGNALIVGGSKNYVGAPTFSYEASAEILTAMGKSSMLVGAGTSALVVPDFLVDAVYPTLRYSAVYSMPSESGGMKFDKAEFSKLVKRKSAVAIGMGMGDGDALSFIRYLLDETKVNFVVDADGLREINGVYFGNRAVLTPHIGEFSRLTGISIAEIKNNPATLALEYAKKVGAVVVLKDSVTYVSDGEVVYENKTGNASLSKGGSGDVLSGIICGLLAQGFSLLDAGRAGSYILGRAAELNSVNEYSSLPTDVVTKIADTVGELCALNKAL